MVRPTSRSIYQLPGSRCTGILAARITVHPINLRNQLDAGHGDWANCSDGIRLTWNDELTNAEHSKNVKAELEGGTFFCN